jgi:predicted permease
MSLLHDLLQALRGHARKPGFAALMVLTLALGISAAATFASLAYALLVRPLPYRDAGRLAMVWEEQKAEGVEVTSYPTFEDWRARAHTFETLAAARAWRPTLRTPDGPVRLQGAEVSLDFFPTLGVVPALGRLLQPEDFRPDAAPVVVLGHRLWRQRFGADPSVVGRAVALLGTPRTIVGVLRADTPLSEPIVSQDAELAIPLRTSPNLLLRGQRLFRVTGRLRPGVSVEQASTEMRRLSLALGREHPETNGDWTASAGSLRELAIGTSRSVVLILLGAALLVLLVACTNIANLLLVRASGRRRELAVRFALGAARGRVLRLLMLEGLPLALAGWILGLVLTSWGWTTATAVLPATTARLTGVTFGGPLLAASALIAGMSAVLVHLAPMLLSTRLPLVEMLTEDTVGTGATRALRRSQGVIVGAEVALTIVLMIGAGLLLHSLLRLSHVDLGFRPEHVLTVELNLPPSKYQEPQQAQALFGSLERALAARGWVRSMGLVSNLPLKRGYMRTQVAVVPGRWLDWMIDFRGVSPRYFATMGIVLRRGRDFTAADGAQGRQVAIVNTAAAERLWPGQDPVGKVLRLNWSEGSRPEVVGLVGNVHHEGIDRPPLPEVYLPYQEVPFWSMNLVLRSALDLRSAGVEMRRLLRGLDPDLLVVSVAPLRDIVADSAAKPRTYGWILGAFAVLGLVLTAIGVFSVTAFVVSTRRREVGVRIALGAQRPDLLRMLLWEGLRPVGLGLLLGLVGAYLLSRLMAGLLFEVQPWDPWVFAVIPLVVVLVSLWALYVPLDRATRVDPVRAIREG